MADVDSRKKLYVPLFSPNKQILKAYDEDYHSFFNKGYIYFVEVHTKFE